MRLDRIVVMSTRQFWALNDERLGFVCRMGMEWLRHDECRTLGVFIIPDPGGNVNPS